jgi:hypothetical protein
MTDPSAAPFQPGSPMQLYQPVRYRASDGSWHADFLEAAGRSGAPLHWDASAVASILSYGYACGDRTLLREISRQPWLSQIDAQGEPSLLEIPPHGRAAPSPDAIAQGMRDRLLEEVVSACQGRRHVYVLLSGGLDSRIAAGVLAQGIEAGRIQAEVTAVTWGLPDCRDVAYAKAAAGLLGFGWQHVELAPEHLLENIETCAAELGSLICPIHLHRMKWFHGAPREAVVFNASYGDSIGRAEFSQQHLLEMEFLQAPYPGPLMHPGAYRLGAPGLRADLDVLRRRSLGQPKYAVCELEGQGHYMRGLIAHAMNVLNRHCTLCQVFTSPGVYGYLWSIHPSLRTDRPYADVLERLRPGLARLPWARTNRAMRGATVGADERLRPDYHDYYGWIAGPLRDRLSDGLDVNWLAATGLFARGALEELRQGIGQRAHGDFGAQRLLWLLSLQKLGQSIEKTGVQIVPAEIEADGPPPPPASLRVRLGQWARGSKSAVRAYRRLIKPARRYFLRRRALRLYPPEAGPRNEPHP